MILRSLLIQQTYVCHIRIYRYLLNWLKKITKLTMVFFHFETSVCMYIYVHTVSTIDNHKAGYCIFPFRNVSFVCICIYTYCIVYRQSQNWLLHLLFCQFCMYIYVHTALTMKTHSADYIAFFDFEQFISIEYIYTY